MTGAREGEEGIPGQVDRRWLFGPVVLDERTLELQVQGRPVEIERKSLQVLIHLLNHAGEVVTKDELLAGVWPGRILSDSVLTSCMARLRDALGDETQGAIKTVHGYGYRLIAPVKVEAAAAAAPARFEFKPGEHLPARPLWSMIERLGTGGHGEAWLARHDKTHERRVYKFAADSSALVTLKREITIYRLLHDSLGDRPDLVHLLDWNLEEPPYFVEYDHLEAGSLSTWANAQGGPDRIPLGTRLDIAAQVADALAAAHSVGVLHKDLKPSNILIEPREGGPPQIKLCDFGSGGVLDPRRLEQMGITRLGFTKTVTHAAAGGTPMYLAPEVMGGQPFTVQSDIYGLGVLLYQLTVGNFHKSLAPGWEQDVADELLREDIALAAEGHPERRLADAARLAQRLRTLDERRSKLEAERVAKAEAESARLEMERMRARRGWVLAALVILVVGLAATTVLYVRADQAATTTQAVSDFLNQDVLSSADPWLSLTKDLTVKQALDRAAAKVPERFADRPEVAAALHKTIGEAYMRMEQSKSAREHLQQAAVLYEETTGARSELRLSVLQSLGDTLLDLSLKKEGCETYEELLRYREGRLDVLHPKRLRARFNMAVCHGYLGDIVASNRESRDVLEDALRAEPQDEALLSDVRAFLAQVLVASGDLDEGEKLHREVLAYFSKKYGDRHIRTALQREQVALVLDNKGRYDEAAQELERGLHDLLDWADETNVYTLKFLWKLGAARMRQGRLDEAAALEEDALARARSIYGDEHEYMVMIPGTLSSVYREQGNYDRAIQLLKPAIALGEKMFGAEYPATLQLRIGLANILRLKGDYPAAWAALQAVPAKGLASLPPGHRVLSTMQRVKGLLLLQRQQFDEARQALAESLAIYEKTAGPEHPDTKAVRAELAGIPRP